MLTLDEIKDLMQCIGYWTGLIQFSEHPHNDSNYIIRYSENKAIEYI